MVNRNVGRDNLSHGGRLDFGKSTAAAAGTVVSRARYSTHLANISRVSRDGNVDSNIHSLTHTHTHSLTRQASGTGTILWFSHYLLIF